MGLRAQEKRYREYEALCRQRSQKRVEELIQRRVHMQKEHAVWVAQRNIRKEHERLGCAHELGLPQNTPIRFDATVDGYGHFTGVTVYYRGGSRWIYTGRNVRDLHARWERLGESLTKRTYKAHKRR